MLTDILFLISSTWVLNPLHFVCFRSVTLMWSFPSESYTLLKKLIPTLFLQSCLKYQVYKVFSLPSSNLKWPSFTTTSKCGAHLSFGGFTNFSDFDLQWPQMIFDIKNNRIVLNKMDPYMLSMKFIQALLSILQVLHTDLWRPIMTFKKIEKYQGSWAHQVEFLYFHYEFHSSIGFGITNFTRVLVLTKMTKWFHTHVWYQNQQDCSTLINVKCQWSHHQTCKSSILAKFVQEIVTNSSWTVRSNELQTWWECIPWHGMLSLWLMTYDIISQISNNQNSAFWLLQTYKMVAIFNKTKCVTNLYRFFVKIICWIYCAKWFSRTCQPYYHGYKKQAQSRPRK